MKHSSSSASIAIIIVNWNGEKFLPDCFSALSAQTFQRFKVIFVDNASVDTSLEWMRSHYPDAEVIKNDGNYGFARANNIGIRAALADPAVKYILTLNNDTIADRHFLKELFAAAEASDPSVGSWQGKVVAADEPRLIDAVGIELYQNSVAAQIGYREIDDGQYASGEIYGVNAAAALYSRRFIEDISDQGEFFDEDFFAYLEDVDVAIRGVNAGWKAQYISKALIRHIGSATSGRESPFQWRLTSRNKLYVAIKNYSGKELRQTLVPSIRYELRLILGFVAKRQLPVLRTFLWARCTAVVKLPKMIRKRKQIRGRRRVDTIFAPPREKLPPASGNTRLSVVIPNWNGREDIGDCLDSLAAQSLKNIQTIVVDNGSQDGSVEFIRQHYPWAIVIPQATNLGFAGGVNTGIRSSTGTFIALLNNDAVANKDWAERLVESMDHADIAASLMIRSYDKRIDSAGEALSKWGIPYPTARGREVAQMPEQDVDIFAASGGASVYSRQMLQQIGMFDPQFFAYVEDVDISFRARLAGYRVVLNPQARVLHKVGATSGKLGHFARYQLLKNTHFLLLKNMPFGLFMRMLPRFVYVQILLLGAAIKNGAGLVALKAYGVVLVSMPITLYKRRRIQTSRTIPVADIAAFLTSHWPLNRRLLRR